MLQARSFVCVSATVARMNGLAGRHDETDAIRQERRTPRVNDVLGRTNHWPRTSQCYRQRTASILSTQGRREGGTYTYIYSFKKKVDKRNLNRESYIDMHTVNYLGLVQIQIHIYSSGLME